MSQLDLAFLCDCTGSMGSYIRSAQDNIRGIATQISERATAGTSLRYALIKYRDHPPQDSSYITQTHDFTESIAEMKGYVDTMSAQGGGDGPEAVSAALHELTKLTWRPNATKVVVFIADAPPHGLGEDGDGFPNGCPLGTDPIKTCKWLASQGITVYSVGVEPVLSQSYKFARDFMMMVAKVTEGKFLPLGKAEILAKVIVSGALEGINMQDLWATLEQEVESEAKSAGVDISKISHEAKIEMVSAKVAKANAVLENVEVANPYMANYDAFNCDAMGESESLASVRQKLDSKRNAHVKEEVAHYGWQQQSAMCAPQAMSMEQAQRMVSKASKKAH